MWDWKKFKEVVNDVISGGAVSAEKAGKELKTAGEERAYFHHYRRIRNVTWHRHTGRCD